MPIKATNVVLDIYLTPRPPLGAVVVMVVVLVVVVVVVVVMVVVMVVVVVVMVMVDGGRVMTVV